MTTTVIMTMAGVFVKDDFLIFKLKILSSRGLILCVIILRYGISYICTFGLATCCRTSRSWPLLRELDCDHGHGCVNHGHGCVNLTVTMVTVA